MILALQTADSTTHLWLFVDAKTPDPIAVLDWESGRQLSDHLLGRTTQFLADHHTTLTDLTGLIIYSGPGSFTGLRIGHATFNALADSLGIPIVGATGPDWLATACAALAHARPDHPVLPHYGAEANITAPRTNPAHPGHSIKS